MLELSYTTLPIGVKTNKVETFVKDATNFCTADCWLPQPSSCNPKYCGNPQCACLLLSPQATACTEQICMGSVMTPSQHVRKSEDTRTKEEVLLLAKDFIDQYYSSIKR